MKHYSTKRLKGMMRKGLHVYAEIVDKHQAPSDLVWIRIYDYRVKGGVMEGKGLGTGKWYPILQAEVR